VSASTAAGAHSSDVCSARTVLAATSAPRHAPTASQPGPTRRPARQSPARQTGKVVIQVVIEVLLE
jgi:hypothetical protein